MDIEYKEFIGIYDNSVPVELCEEFTSNWDEAIEKRTIIEEPTHIDFHPERNPLERKDEAAHIWPLSSTIYPVPPVHKYFDCLKECFMDYIKRYSFSYGGPLYNDVFKIHKVQPSEGYHAWHYENYDGNHLDRLVAYMTYLQSPEEGGETEFLHQSMRVEPIVGRTLIWPATFTHIHRGNPPLKGDKLYITGWFTGGRK